MRKPSRASGDVGGDVEGGIAAGLAAGDRDAGEVAAYIADLCRELAAMARSHRFSVLAYILDMAVEDADKQGRDLREPRPS